jgi:hypothetical protein
LEQTPRLTALVSVCVSADLVRREVGGLGTTALASSDAAPKVNFFTVITQGFQS